MSKIKIALEVVEDLHSLADSIEALAKSMEGQRETESEKGENSLPEKVTIEKVRVVLAEKSRSGKLSEVKALIAKYGGNKLTDLDPACYGELLKDVQAL